jgi:hypothetical protein
VTQYDVRRLAAHAGQRRQRVHLGRHLPAVPASALDLARKNPVA